MTELRYVGVRQVMARLDLKESKAYEVMTEAGAIKFGRCLRLSEGLFEEYIRRCQSLSSRSEIPGTREFSGLMGRSSGGPRSAATRKLPRKPAEGLSEKQLTQPITPRTKPRSPPP